jgi:hypothetical protein
MGADGRTTLQAGAGAIIEKVDAFSCRRDFAAEAFQLGVPQDHVPVGGRTGLDGFLGELEPRHRLPSGSK